MKEKPIIFSTEMVKAILAERKTMTRRVIKKKYDNTHIEWFKNKYGTRLVEMQDNIEGETFGVKPDGISFQKILGYREIKCPWEVGDVLWVRETWNQALNTETDELGYVYKEQMLRENVIYTDLDDDPIKWRPSRYMPRKAARLFLKVKDIRVERVQDITEEDAIAEGCEKLLMETRSARNNFMNLWNSINTKRGYIWAMNNWVWAVEFERVEV